MVVCVMLGSVTGYALARLNFQMGDLLPLRPDPPVHHLQQVVEDSGHQAGPGPRLHWVAAANICVDPVWLLPDHSQGSGERGPYSIRCGEMTAGGIKG